jgi:hypothetical protein
MLTAGRAEWCLGLPDMVQVCVKGDMSCAQLGEEARMFVGQTVMNILFSFISFFFVMSFSHRTILSLLLHLYYSLDHITPLLLICH